MSGHGSKQSKDEALIAALLAAPTLEGAAGLCGVPLSTVKRRLATPEFKKQYTQARAGLLERTTVRLLAATCQAVATLERGLTRGRAADRLRAANSILVHAAKGMELLDLSEQLNELKAVGGGHEP
jgi:hypothetical protein